MRTAPLKRIKFIRAKEPYQSFVSALGIELELSASWVDHLIHLGAIYGNGQRVKVDRAVAEGELIRIHTEPKRFTLPKNPIQIIAELPEFVVAVKPAGIPTHATLDNSVENLHYLLQKQLEQTLFITHRLDQMTAGLIVFAKTTAFQSLYNHWLKSGAVEKIYQVLCDGEPPLGSMVHYMLPGKIAPRQVVSDPTPGAKRCELIVLLTEKHHSGFYLCTVKLLTGRTHQIRAQFAASQVPLVGDSTYGSILPPLDSPSLTSCSLTLPGYGAYSVL